MKSANRTILVAGMGTSPAVLTETVWALAHQEQPVYPDVKWGPSVFCHQKKELE